jgi:predicted glycoside hydrolase/deacetylase ChbG (UPF0249 family)
MSQSQTIRHIIVNADDFGMSPLINRAILRAFEAGLISSATIMANMPGFDQACKFVREHGLHRRVGLHLNFTAGSPLSADIARCPNWCDTSGIWRKQRAVITLSRQEKGMLDAEITAQVSACERNGITPTHFDSHHHMHTQPGIAPVVIRAARRLGVNAIRLGPNCGPGREGASQAHRVAARAQRYFYNVRLRLNGLARTEYFGDARDTYEIVRKTRANVEVMVHPSFDSNGRLVDLDGQDLKSRIEELCIPAGEMCSYHDVLASVATLQTA